MTNASMPPACMSSCIPLSAGTSGAILTTDEIDVRTPTKVAPEAFQKAGMYPSSARRPQPTKPTRSGLLPQVDLFPWLETIAYPCHNIAIHGGATVMPRGGEEPFHRRRHQL